MHATPVSPRGSRSNCAAGISCTRAQCAIVSGATTVGPVAADILKRDPVLAEIVRRLRNAYQPERIYLFGSAARGDAGADSDYDLLVVVPDDAPRERQTSRLAYEVLWGTGVAADVLVWPRGRFDSRLHLKASLPATVEREGKLVHAA